MRAVAVFMALLMMLVAGCSGRATVKPIKFQQISYSYTGGIAGFDQHITIQSDGTYQISEKGREGSSGNLKGDELDQLKSLMTAVEWPLLQPKYVDTKIADATFDTVSLHPGEKSYEVVVGTGASGPDELGALIVHLKQVLQHHR